MAPNSRRHNATQSTSSTSSHGAAAPTNSDQPPVPISITICGDGGCGKSSITLRLVRSQWVSEYDPTIEDCYSLTRRVDGVTYHLTITDTAGQEEYRGMWASSSLGSDAFLLVYDITSPDSLESLQYFNEMIDMEAEMRMDNAERARKAGLLPPPRGDGSPASPVAGFVGASAKVVPPIKMVAGNKCDLAEGREVPAQQGLEWARRRGCGFMETSARLEVNIEETFRMIIRRVVEARRIAETGGVGGANGVPEANKHGVTKPLTPLPAEDENDGDDEKRGRKKRDSKARNSKLSFEKKPSFWRTLKCW